MGTWRGPVKEEDIAEFLKLPENDNDELPYSWSTSVTSIDGRTSFAEDGANDAVAVALGHTHDSGRAADWAVLTGGWRQADAVIGSGSILRSEPKVRWTCPGASKPPLNVVLSRSGNLPVHHPMLVDPSQATAILTTVEGGAKLMMARSKDEWDQCCTEIVVAGEDESEVGGGGWRMKAVMIWLKKVKRCDFVDVTSAGEVLRAMLDAKLLNEMRFTVAGHLLGPVNSTGARRPGLLDVEGSRQAEAWNVNSNPQLEYRAIRVVPPSHLFIRASVTYREST